MKRRIPRIDLYLTYLSAFFLSASVCAQNLPDFNAAFLQDEIARVDIQIHPDSLAAILHIDSLYNDHEFPATFIYSASGIQDTVYNIGFRLRGNTSRVADKKSFKVSFNTFIPGNKYQGLEKMNLNGSHNDPSNLRVKLYWDALRAVGLRGSRTSHVNFYINGEFRGVYTHVEHIDEEFVDAHFQHGDGNLWKCLFPADLAYLGNSGDDYKIEAFGRRVYDLKTNREADNYDGLATFLTTLNNTTPAQLECNLPSVFNIEEYLRFAAIDVLFGNWDNYIFNRNNYYLYEDPSNNKLSFIAYDLDNVLGIDWFGLDWTERDPYNWSPGPGTRPLYDAIMNVPAWRAAFTQYLDEYDQFFIQNGWIAARAQELQEAIAPSMEVDPYAPLDYGYDYNSFLDAIDEAAGGHVQYGILPFLERRSEFLSEQIETYTPTPLFNWVQDNTPVVQENSLIVNASVSGPVDNVELLYTFDNGEEQILAMQELNGQWMADLDLSSGIDRLNYTVRVNHAGDSKVHTCEPVLVWLSPGSSGLVINELMPLNTSTITDETGAFADWLELYAGGTAVNLSSIYLSDNPAEPWRWNIPAVTMESDSYRLIWADSDTDEGPFHASFDLDAQGESLALFSRQKNAWRLLDFIEFGPSSADFSLARICDGDDNWQVTDSPSPGISNCLVGVSESQATNQIIAYPNPSDGNFFLSEPLSGEVYNLQGKLITSFTNTQQIDLSGMETGIYLVVLSNQQRLKLIRI